MGLKVGDYIQVDRRRENFWGTVESVAQDDFPVAIVVSVMGNRRMVFRHDKITLVNLIEANE